MIKQILLFILIPSICFAAPVNNFSERNGKTMTIYSYPKYYQDNGWKVTDTNIVKSPDFAWDWEVTKGVYSLKVKNDGTFQFNHLGDSVQEKLVGIGFFNSSTKQRIIKKSLTLSNPTVTGNKISWTLPLGSSYELEYIEDNFKDVLILSQQAKQFLKNNKPAGWLAKDTWIGLIYNADLSGSTLIESKNFETTGDIRFIKNGRIKHKFKRAFVKHDSYDDRLGQSGNIGKIWAKKRFYRNGKYVEAIPVSALNSVNGNLRFNTDVTFQEGVSGYSGMETTYIGDQDSPTANHNGEDRFSVKWDQGGHFSLTALMTWDISSIPDTATIDSVTMDVYHRFTTTQTLRLYDCLRSWVASQATWNNWKTSNAWTTAGARSSGNDLTGTAGSSTGSISSFTGSTASAWTTFTDSASFRTSISNGLAGDTVNWCMHANNQTSPNDFFSMRNEDWATASERPKLNITYTNSRRVVITQ